MAASIPLYEQQVQTPDISMRGSSPYRTPQVSGDAARNLGETASNIGAVMKQENNFREQQALLASDVAAEQAYTKLTVGDTDNPGILKKMGTNAQGITASATQDYANTLGEIAPQVKSQEAKLQWEKMAAVRMQDLTRVASTHEYDQSLAANKEATTNALTNYSQGAVAAASVGDDQGIAAAQTRGEAAIRRQGLIEGWDQPGSSAVADTQVAKWKSSNYFNIIKSTFDNDPINGAQQALPMLAKYRGDMTFEDQDKADTLVKPTAVNNYAQAQFNAQWGLNQPTPAQAVTANPNDADAFAKAAIPAIQHKETGSLPNAATAVSSKGAVGTYQMLPATAAAAAQRLGIAFSPDDLKDPAKSQVLAQEELRNLYQNCVNKGVPAQNRAAVAFAGYNMGMGAALKWAAGKDYQTEDGTMFHPLSPCDPNALPTKTKNYIADQLQGSTQNAIGQRPAKPDMDAWIMQQPVALQSHYRELASLYLNGVAQREAMGERALNQVDAQIDSGIKYKPEQEQQWRNMVRGTSSESILDAHLHAQDDVQSVMEKSPAEQAQWVQEQQQKIDQSGGSLRDRQNLNRITEAVQRNITSMQTQPLLWAQNRLGTATEPLDFTKITTPVGADAFGTEIGNRMDTVTGLQKTQGMQVQPNLLLPQEVGQIRNYLSTASAAQSVQLFGQLNDAIKNPQAYSMVMGQLRANDPISARAGEIAGKNQNVTLPSGQANTTDIATTLLKGAQALGPARDGDGKPSGFPMPDSGPLRAAFTAAVGDAYAANPTVQEQKYEEFRSYYAGKTLELGKTAQGGLPDPSVTADAIAATQGSTTKFNGHTAVAPYGMNEQDFRDRAAVALAPYAAKHPDLASQGYLTPAYDARGQVVDGLYHVSLGRAPMYNAKGQMIGVRIDANSPAQAPVTNVQPTLANLPAGT